jgi:hypothetical protein
VKNPPPAPPWTQCAAVATVSSETIQPVHVKVNPPAPVKVIHVTARAGYFVVFLTRLRSSVPMITSIESPAGVNEPGTGAAKVEAPMPVPS